jgi:bifunctional N-acetylglucosamine-1-phosphate-uridyltransferase/glucosamine-1-phosphate-acetyltransferase GlmU-like protein
MGDVPFVKKETYRRLIEQLDNHSLMVLGFCPKNKKQYGIFEIDKGRVQRIIEWKYWKTYSEEKQEKLNICNAGIYAARKSDLLRYLSILALRPQKVHKEVDGKLLELEEFFITDLVEYMVKDGLSVGYVIAQDETEAIGIDDLATLEKAQEVFQREEI